MIASYVNRYNNLYKAYGAYNNTLGSTLAGEVKKNVFNARTHNYKTARERALSNNHIPEEVYDNLVKTVHKYLPLLHRYTKLRKELLVLMSRKCTIYIRQWLRTLNLKCLMKKQKNGC